MNLNTTLETDRTYYINHAENGFSVIGEYMLYTGEFDEELNTVVSEPFSISIYKDGKLYSQGSGASASFDIPKNKFEIQKILADFMLTGYQNDLVNDKEFNDFLYNTTWEIN